jgi:hypothetical protein
LDEAGERLEPSISLEAFMQVCAGLDLAEKFEQRPCAEAMETASQITKALAWKSGWRVLR